MGTPFQPSNGMISIMYFADAGLGNPRARIHLALPIPAVEGGAIIDFIDGLSAAGGGREQACRRCWTKRAACSLRQPAGRRKWPRRNPARIPALTSAVAPRYDSHHEDLKG